MSETAKFTPVGPSLIYGVTSDKGTVRPIDEDSYWSPPPDMDRSMLAEKGWLFIVADGMGGYHGGEVASQIAVQAASQTYYSYPTAEGAGGFDPTEALRKAVLDAHQGILTAGAKVVENRQMGSTIVMAVVRGSDLYVANVGDSRCYRLRAGQLEQLTRDHSWVAEEIRTGRIPPQDVRQNPNRSMLIRGLGKTSASAKPDIDHYDWKSGDRLLLCCDGMWDMLDDERLIHFVSMSDPQAASAGMVAAANAGGSQDNVTALIVLDTLALPAVAATATAVPIAPEPPTVKVKTGPLAMGAPPIPPSATIKVKTGPLATAVPPIPPAAAIKESTAPLAAPQPKSQRIPTLAIGAVIVGVAVTLAIFFVLSQVLSPVRTASEPTARVSASATAFATSSSERESAAATRPAAPTSDATQTISQELAVSTPIATASASPAVQETATLGPRMQAGVCITGAVNVENWEWNPQASGVQSRENGIAVWGGAHIGTRQPITQYFPLPEVHAPFSLVVMADLGRFALNRADVAVCFHDDINAPQSACARTYKTTTDVTNISTGVWAYRFLYNDLPIPAKLRVISLYPSEVVITQVVYCQQ